MSLIGWMGMVACTPNSKLMNAKVEDEAPLTQKSIDAKIGRGDRIAGRNLAGRSPVLARNGMAATAHPLATQVAVDILKKGGSAVDAAIAANATLGFLEPVGCGIGGDLFALIWDPESKKVVGFNGSGRSPKGRSLADLKKILKNESKIPSFGSLSVTVPGAVDGWFQLHEKYGKLPIDQVLAPAIQYAKLGAPMAQTIGYYWKGNLARLAEYKATQPWLEELDNAKALYAPGGKPPAEGEVFANPELAQTYEYLTKEGRDGFYKGKVAKTIDAYMQKIGGALRYSDLAEHTGEWVTPISVSYRGYEVYELPPNTQGLAALQMLAILDGMDLGDKPSARSMHLQVEAKRIAFEDRARSYADPAFSNIDPKSFLTPKEVERRRALIKEDAVWTAAQLDPSQMEEGDTTYLTVADASGMMVSLIQSNYRGLGSGLVPDGLGFMLQDRGELFTLEAGHANVYAPGKRPFHTIIPAMVTLEGQGWLSFGVMGGGMQPQGHVQVLNNIIDFGYNLQEAGDAARWRHDGSTQPTGVAAEGQGVLRVESGIPEAIREQLRAIGHKVEIGTAGFGGYQAILRDPKTGVYHGASELRKDGMALGY